MATTTLRSSAAQSRSCRLRWLRLVICAVALPTLLLASLIAASPALAADPTEISVPRPRPRAASTRATRCPSPGRPTPPVASGQFSIWVVSPANGWYVGKIHDAAERLPLRRQRRPRRARRHRLPRLRLLPRHERRPVGPLRRLARARSTWRPCSARSPSRPWPRRGLEQGDPLPVTWTTNAAGRERPVQHLGGLPGERLVRGQDPRRRRASPYADSVDLNVPAGTGYRVYVYYRATSGDPWGLYGASPDTVDVAAVLQRDHASPPLAGTSGQSQGDPLPVSLDDQRRRSPAASSASGWSPRRTAGTWARSTTPPTPALRRQRRPRRARRHRLPRLRLLPRHERRPVGPLRRLARARSTWPPSSTRSRVRAPGREQPEPGRPAARQPGRPTRRSPAASSASGWSPRRTAGTWARSTTPPSLPYADSVDLDVPAGTGYRVYVYYRATGGDPWGLYGASPGHGRRRGARLDDRGQRLRRLSGVPA